MTRPDSRLLFIIFVLGLMLLAWGCSQSDDITASVSLTNVWLRAERLPTPPPGMVYELWASKVAVTDTTVPTSQLVSLGTFSYISNDTLVAFLEPAGQLRADSNKFVLNADMHDYASLFVTVEQINDPAPLRPGPIMLIHSITGNTDTLRLTFPLSDGFDNLWGKSVQFNLESVSDLDRTLQNGYGLWFSTYEYNIVAYPDTLSQTLAFPADTILPVVDSVTGDTLNKNLLGQMYRDTTLVSVDTFYRVFGRDTLTLDYTGPFEHIFVQLTDSFSVRNSFPIIFVTPEPDSTEVQNQNISLDIFKQDDSLPVYDDWGWKYQGWIVGEHIPTSAIGQITPPAWQIVWLNEDRIPGHKGGLLTTGKFSRVSQPDDADPFTLKVIDRIEVDSLGNTDTIYERPMVAGEDFLDGAALSAATGGVINAPFRITPGSGADSASVFISLEPANKPAALDSTNFPLIALVGQIPTTWNFPTSPTDTATIRQVKMRNWVQHVPGDFMGFPQITAELQRQ